MICYTVQKWIPVVMMKLGATFIEILTYYGMGTQVGLKTEHRLQHKGITIPKDHIVFQSLVVMSSTDC